MIHGKTARPARASGLTWLFLGLAGLALLTTGGQIVGFYTDWLWFHEVRFTSVFVTVLETQALLGAVTGAAFFLILYGNVALARRLASREVLLAVDDNLGMPSPEVLDPYVRRLSFPVSVMLALFVGWLGTDRWELVLKSQLQEIRTYYKFTDIDIDRYRINGEYRQVTLSPRELSSRDLPSRIWINERLTYTHGYGAVVGPVNRVTREGLPEFWVKDIPPAASTDLRISRPELYFSELATDYVFVRTRAKEFDYPAGDQNVYTAYDGEGGIPLGSVWRKMLFAAHLGDIKLLMSNDLTSASRVLLYRNIRERVQRIAPFLRYDGDPYMVISTAGRIVWLLDAYTISDWFPYSAATRGLGNYIRNAVKVTVDAYDGTVHFYVADPADPLIRTIGRIFPGLLQPLDAMPADLRAHIRYPEGLFRIQAAMYAVYHMRDTQATTRRTSGASRSGTGTDRIGPWNPTTSSCDCPANLRNP